LPLTPNGKLDHGALPTPDAARSNGHHAPQPARDDIERELVAIWTEVLGIEGIGVEDNFFELGGHSLLATQVVARVRNALGVQLPLHLLFTSPTVAGLAAEVRELQRAAEPDEDELAMILRELENMTDEEAERLLSLETAGDE
jgi:acyl carrier protein